jgi:uracil-DNA glycosylase
MVRASSLVHSSWKEILAPFEEEIQQILFTINTADLAPSVDSVFKALEIDIAKVRVVIFGQDPYPSQGNATGLAFSVPRDRPLPASLRNIYQELNSDIGISPPSHGDLTSWKEEGVLLLNRVLTTRIGQAGAHSKVGWQKITDHLARELGQRHVIALLWGKNAEELSPYFSDFIISAHPSPLSAYRGFFGSKPFSRINHILQHRGERPIDWSIK